MKLILKYVITICFAFALFLMPKAQTPVNVNLQLKWKHQFQFAGYYAAIQKGYYQEAGINVNLIEAVDGVNPDDAVFEGKAEFGVSNSEILLERAKGKKAVVLATIFQHSPQILLASKKSGINHVQDLVGKRIALESNSVEIIAFLNDEGISAEECTILTHAFNVNQLIAGEIDAISAYSTDEPFILKEAKFEYTIISPSMGGLDFYGDLLFTTESFIKSNPELTDKFLKASLKGWQYAMNNPDEIVDLIYEKYTQRHSVGHLRFEADQMNKLIMPQVVEIGYTNPGRWVSIANTFKKLNLADNSLNIKGFLFADYVESGAKVPFRIIGLVLAIFVIISAISYNFYLNNRRLKSEIKTRIKIETELRESEEKFRTLIETMTDGVYRSTHDGRFVDVNQAMVDILGYESKEELLAIDIKTQLYFAEEERESADLVQKLEETSVFRLRRKDGTIIWVEDHGRHVLDDKGNIMYHEGTLRNVTERKMIEDALQRSEERYRNLIENMGEGVGFTNEKEVFIYANPSAEKIFGTESGKLAGLSLWDFIPTENVEFIKSETNKRSTGSSSVFELKIITNDGTVKDILITATPSFSMNKFQGTFAIFRDITERKKTELEIKRKNEELQKLIATKDKFFSIIAHDLKSPFNAIVGFSELLVEKVKDNDYDGIAKFAGIILESSERAMALLLNLMDWSLSQTGRMEFIPEYFEYIEFINNLTLPYQDIAGQKSITITKELPHTMPVFADKAMISTVLRNLISNAIKFTRPGGEIMISVEEKPGELITAIKDNGVGISPTTVARLFRIDENVTTIGTNKEKGTGLGLILCKEFVENHGGKIWVDSQEGKGSKFTFTIPTSK